MIDSKESLLPYSKTPLRVFSVGFDENPEMGRLLASLGVERAGHLECVVRKVNAGTYIGRGKLREVKERAAECGAKAVVLDTELTPNQMRNIATELELAVMDRPGVIIEIFSQHARTKEAKTQVELAKLQYLLPRLRHFWTHFERQWGKGRGSKGMGEKQIEVDRRLLKKRIQTLKSRLKSIEKTRKTQRAARAEVLKVALVGYTNAGKSTLLNRLTDSEVTEEDQLFATLDSSVRALDPHSQPPVVMIDTVGFIERIPTHLIASFRSTLEELQHADLLLHVVDASSVRARDERRVAKEVLDELGLGEVPVIEILNKMDCVSGAGDLNWIRALAPGALRVSALDPDDIRRAREAVLKFFRERLEVMEIFLPYGEGRLEAKLHEHAKIEVIRHMKKGTFYRVRMERTWAQKLGLEEYGLRKPGGA